MRHGRVFPTRLIAQIFPPGKIVDGTGENMKRSLLVLAAVAAVGLVAGGASAGTVTNVTLYASNYSSTTNVTGNSSSAPGFGNSSWQADTTAASTVDNKSELYIPVAAIFSGSVTISDIASISYWTNKPGDAGSPDWSLNLYTNPSTTLADNEASWYQSRLTAEPYLTNTSDASDPSNTWHQWSTNDASNPLRFYDSGRDGGVQGTYTDPTLSNLASGSVTWNGATENGSSYDYSAETIKYFSLQTGTGWADGFDGLVDGLTITLNNGDVANVNLESVPLPASAWSGLALLGGLAAFGGFKRLRKQMA
jgi:hypothetical protein